jgi:hypothetical protein
VPGGARPVDFLRYEVGIVPDGAHAAGRLFIANLLEVDRCDPDQCDVNEPPHPHPPPRAASARKVVAMATIFAAWNTVFLPE